MAAKIAFMFVAAGAHPERCRAKFYAKDIELEVIGVDNYRMAEEWARKLADGGVQAIELCAGFGHEGVARVVRAVQGKAFVGAVRFDNHPCIDGKSGDALFGD
ncbi:MAG: DUF6506 family protein [Moorellaceae bacterium]